MRKRRAPSMQGLRRPAIAACRGSLSAALCVALSLACSPGAPDGGLPTHPSDRFSVTLAWDAPATDATGNALEDLAAFRIYHSPVLPPDGTEGTQIDVGDATEYTVENLAPGTYYFAVTAVDVAGNESRLSEVLQVEVGS